MLAMILLVELGIECSYSCFKEPVIAKCQIRSLKTGLVWTECVWTKEIYDEIVTLLEASTYETDDFNTGKTSSYCPTDLMDGMFL